MFSIKERAERARFADACEQLVAEGCAVEFPGGAIKLIVKDPKALQERLAEVEIKYAQHFDKLADEHDRQDREAWKRLVEEYPELRRPMTVTPDRFIPDQGWGFPGDY